jgi:hypothetical protein
VFGAIHDGAPDQALLSYQYLQMLPQLAQGEANKIWVIPSEFSQALGGLADRFGASGATVENGAPAPPPRRRPPSPERLEASERAAADAAEAARAAAAASAEAASAATPGALPRTPPETP